MVQLRESVTAEVLINEYLGERNILEVKNGSENSVQLFHLSVEQSGETGYIILRTKSRVGF